MAQRNDDHTDPSAMEQPSGEPTPESAPAGTAKPAAEGATGEFGPPELDLEQRLELGDEQPVE